MKEIEKIMKIFVITKENHDTCGNSWTTEGSRHIVSDSIRTVWEKTFSQSPVNSYKLKNGSWIHRLRTPKGRGYGIWEDNPEFDFPKHLAYGVITGFRVGSFTEEVVEEKNFEML